MRAITELGHLEQSVMEAMWRKEKATVHQICEDLGDDRAYTTIMTTLDRLFKKGLLTRVRQGRSFVYQPAMDRAGLVARKTRDFWDTALAGASDPRPVLSCFIDAVSEHDRAVLDELEELIRKKRKQLR